MRYSEPSAEDLRVLQVLDRYCLLSRPQIQRATSDKSIGSSTSSRGIRRRLTRLVHNGWVSRVREAVRNEASLYQLSSFGREILSEATGNESILNRSPCLREPLNRWNRVSDTLMRFDRDCHERLNLSALKHGGYGELFTKSDNSQITACPDAAFLLHYESHVAACYLRIDNARYHPRRAWAHFEPGFRWLHHSRHYRRHFPGADVSRFLLLYITHSTARLEALHHAWSGFCPPFSLRLAAVSETVVENVYFGPVWKRLNEQDSTPLIQQ